MPKVHMVASESPLNFGTRASQEALCRQTVSDAKPIYMLDLNTGEMFGISTISFCTVCLKLALTPVQGKRYVYGITEAQVALDTNED